MISQTSESSNGKRLAPSTARRTLVLVDSVVKEALPDRIAALERAGAVVEFVDYGRLASYVERLRHIVREQGIDFVLFSRNDQVFDKISIGPIIRALRVGYSSFSGIDTPDFIEQTRICLDDYLSGDARLAPAMRSNVPEPRPRSGMNSAKGSQAHKKPERSEGFQRSNGQTGTFSLIFDLEQIGGARFGLPRILDLLDRYGVKATFFTTNFVQEVYGDVTEVITSRGHEIGLHGLYHEYLAGRFPHEQHAMIGQMKHDFGPGVQITGANFIGRMDEDTVQAMVANGLRYWVVFMEHRYSPFAYRKMPLRPLPVWTPQGIIWMVPISVETNNRPWFSVKNMLDSSVVAAQAEWSEAQSWPHVNVLLHPFRDGTREHIGDLERILVHMQSLGYRGVPVSEVVSCLAVREPEWSEAQSFVYYPLDGSPRISTPVGLNARPGFPAKARENRATRAWWHNAARYQQRIWRVYRELETRGRQPALCMALPETGTIHAVYPYLPGDDVELNFIEEDPLLAGWALDAGRVKAGVGESFSVNAFVPCGHKKDLVNATRAMLPRFGQDIKGLFPEVALRVAYRLSQGRHIF